MKTAVVLLSGGLDSATVLAMAHQQGYVCHCLSMDYGQRHRAELVAAARVAKALGAAQHRVVKIDLAGFGGSALTDANIAVPTSGIAPGIPVTYVPARNTILLSFALANAEVSGANDIFFGANAVDYSGYPDCRPDFVKAYEIMQWAARGLRYTRRSLRYPRPISFARVWRWGWITRSLCRVTKRRTKALPAANATPAGCAAQALSKLTLPIRRDI
jgi:queuosine biosynthesis protein QueC